MNYCHYCVLPNTRPNLVIDESGRCNACQSSNQKVSQINWQERQSHFQQLVDTIKQKAQEWDCVIPVSGGKDSTWQVIKALEYGLKPLCGPWRTPARNAIGQKNLDNLIQLGVDHIDFTINPDVEKKFTLAAFQKKGSLAIPMHMALFGLPLQVASKFKIPLVLWGENSGMEYGGVNQSTLGGKMTRDWLLSYGVTQGTLANYWVSDQLTLKDLSPYIWPTDQELDSSGVTPAFLGWFFHWDPVETFRVAQEHGFESLSGTPKTGYYKFADVDDEFIIGLHHWLKWYKFGFTRLWDNLSLEIRNNRMTRDEAIQVISDVGDEYPQEAIDKFCQWVGITESSFRAMAEKFRNKDVWTFQNGRWRIKNFLIPNWIWT